MKIELQDSFLEKLDRQIAYIAEDKPKAARKFKADLFNRLKALTKHPSAGTWRTNVA